MTRKSVEIDYFSDVLCVWAYVSQIRLDELKTKLAGDINISYRFVSVFGCSACHIGKTWAQRGGIKAYARHVADIGDMYPHVEIHPAVWDRCRPQTSASCHLFFKALQSLEQEDRLPVVTDGRTTFEEFASRARCAFFRDAQDIGRLDTLHALAQQMELPAALIAERINDGTAMAALCRDFDAREEHGIEGSPTYLLNNGRQ